MHSRWVQWCTQLAGRAVHVQLGCLRCAHILPWVVVHTQSVGSAVCTVSGVSGVCTVSGVGGARKSSGSVGCPQFVESTECTQSVGMVEGTEMEVSSVGRKHVVTAEETQWV